MRLAALFCCSALAFAGPRALDIYFVDVEGGAATLIVTPEGQSLLADTGNPGPGDRDAKRIFAVAQLAGLTRIDYLLTTHYDGDHVGGAPALSKLIPIGRYLDHGDSIQANTPGGAKLWDAYQAISEGKRKVMKPGDKVPLGGVGVEAVSSNGEVLRNPINGGKTNPALCGEAKPKKRIPPKTTSASAFF